jgi:hypothetical protein
LEIAHGEPTTKYYRDRPQRFPIEELALVEPFEPPAEPSPRFTSDKDFKARVVLIDRYNVLTEDTVEAFAEANKFRRLPDDNVATNPAVRTAAGILHVVRAFGVIGAGATMANFNAGRQKTGPPLYSIALSRYQARDCYINKPVARRRPVATSPSSRRCS